MTTTKRMLIGWIPAMIVAVILMAVIDTSHLESFLLGIVFGGIGAQAGLMLTRAD